MLWNVSIVEVGVIPDLPRSLYVPDADPDDLLDVPCLVYVLDDGERVVMVDSGPDADAAATWGYRIVGDTRSELLRGIASHGAAPHDVELIVHTHLHYDHCQNDPVFPLANVVVQTPELASAKLASRYYEGVAAMCSALGTRLAAAQGDTDLFPGLRTIANGGHTPGHQSVLVDTVEGTARICGDIVSFEANTTTVRAACPDVEATESFLRTAAKEGWEMIPSHEPALRGHRWFFEG